MLVWNGFIYDARVTREAETLASQQMEVRVIAVLTEQRPLATETTDAGIEVVRISRRNRWLTRALLAPRALLMRLLRLFRGGPTFRESLKRPARWWEADRKLAMGMELLVGNYRMMRAAGASRPDFVHANDVNTLVPAWLAAKFNSATLIYDAHEISADREGYRGRIWLVRLVEKWLGGAASGCITTTQARADWFIENYDYERMAVVQNRPTRNIVTSNRIREQLAVPPENTVVLYQGGLQWGRGLHNLIDAVRRVPEVSLVFVGDGRQRSDLERAAFDLRERVHFVGQVTLEELPYWTAAADVGVQTLRNTCLNHYTTDSNKLFEYVMGGLPVIASDFPEIRAIVSEHGLGLLVDPDDVGAIADALRKLVVDVDARQTFASNARRARDQLDWQSQAAEFLKVYRQAAGVSGRM